MTATGILIGDDVLAVTKDTARDIFKRHFWDRPRAGEMPPLVGVCFYDFAVNAGVPRAARVLQRLLRVGVDGIVGRNTLTTAASCNQRELASLMLLEREQWVPRTRGEEAEVRGVPARLAQPYL